MTVDGASQIAKYLSANTQTNVTVAQAKGWIEHPLCPCPGPSTTSEALDDWIGRQRVIGRVYFAQMGDGGPIKIGTSFNVPSRIVTLNTSAPWKVVLLGTVYGNDDKEQELHRQFSAHRMNGEWFEPSPDLCRYISTNKLENGR